MIYIMGKRHQRQSDGLYHVGGKTFKLLRGTRAQVWHGTALETQGRLRKHQLMMNKHGRIVSKKKHNTAKREKRLLIHGWGTQRGKFGAVRVGSKRGTAKRRRRRARSAPGTRRVTISEKRNTRTGRFSRGGHRRRRRRR
jgi:hypothetical protein